MTVISAPQEYNTDELYIDLRPTFGHSLYLKCEGLNFAGSVKLKAANEMVEAAERAGVLTPGSVIVESSSGNLGVALAMIAASKGYRFLCVTDSRCNLVTRQIMEAVGSDVHVIVDPCPVGGFLGARLDYVRELCESNDRYVWLNQYTNPNSWKAHYHLTAPAIAAQFPNLEVLFVGAGTTGTLMGCARYFRARMPSVRIVAVDAVGSVTFGGPAGRRMIPGLGSGVVPGLLDESFVDEVVLVEETDTIKACRRLARRGFLFGGSTGTVVSGANRWLADHAPSSPVAVALAPDLGERYLDTIYHDEWVRDLYGESVLERGPQALVSCPTGNDGPSPVDARPVPRQRPVPVSSTSRGADGFGSHIGGSWEHGAWTTDQPQRPRVRGPLPGARSAAVIEGREQDDRDGPGGRLPFVIAEGAGSFVRDLDGNVFADFAAGSGAGLLGHGHPKLAAAVAGHIRSVPAGSDPIGLAWSVFTRSQLDMLPPAMRDRMRVRSCGAEAVESVLRLCRAITGREEAVTFRAGRADALERDWNDRARDGRPLPAAAVLRIGPSWYGSDPADAELAQRIRHLTGAHGVPLVVDESGRRCGRSGRWFAFEEFGIEPDVVIASSGPGAQPDAPSFVLYDKSLGAVVPIGGPGARDGDQLELVIAAETARIIKRDDVLAGVRARGEQIATRLAGLRGHPWVSRVCGQGLGWGIGFAARQGGAPHGLAEKVRDQALLDGLILDVDPEAPDMLRLNPPLTVSAEVVDVACSIVLRAVESVYLNADELVSV
jgi:cysteine synthase A